MSKHVFIEFLNLPKDCPGRIRIEKINSSSCRPTAFKVTSLDVRECFYCKSFRTISTINATDLGRRQKFVLYCTQKLGSCPIEVQ